VALTPDQWLVRLTKRMDERGQRLANLRSYMDGDAPLPEGAQGVRDAYKAFQKKARTNFGELIVDAVCERMIVSGFSVGGQASDDDAVRAIWKRNRLQIGSADVHRDMVGLSAGYVIVSPGQDGALVTCERPEQVITEQAPNRPDLVRAALKVYRDTVDGYDVAHLHLPGRVFTYYRPLRDPMGAWVAASSIAGKWEYAGDEDSGLDVVPVVPFINRGGLGEFETHTDVLDRINWDILQRLVITAMQAYRQRALKTQGDGLPREDEDGNTIDYGEMFKPGAGSLWELPEGVDLWESSATDLTPILSAAKDDLTHLAAVTRTPMPTLMPDGANQTAEGAAFAREGLVFKSQDRVERAKASWNLGMGLALALERGERRPVADVETLWQPVERRSLQERADAATKAQDLPWRDRMTDIWGYSADRVDQMEANRGTDMLMLGLQNTQPPANGSNAPA
jgi:hypothetical protein